MAFDVDVVQARLALIEDNVRKLGRIPQTTYEEFASDFRNTEAAQHLLQVAIEAMIDVCTHFVARLRLKPPGNSAHVVTALGRAGLLPDEHVTRYVNMIRFRNVLVHLYAEVDDERVYDLLCHKLDDFALFVGDAWRIVKSHPDETH